VKTLVLFATALSALAMPLSASSAQEAVVTGGASSAAGLGLGAAIDRAVAGHPSIAAAQASARAAGADVRGAKWQRFPSFSFEGLLLNQSRNPAQAQAVVDQPFWTGGRISGGIDRARAREKAALAAYDEAVLLIALATTQSFFDVHRLRKRIDILDKSFAQHNLMVASMTRRHELEISPLSDLELARSRALQIEQQLFQARAQEGAASARLRELVGDPLFVIGAPPEPPATWPVFADDAIIAKVFQFSPLLSRLRFEAESAVADARVAKSSLLPQVSGQYNYSEMLGHRVGLVLRAQTDGGLSRYAAASAAQQRVQASELQIVAGERQVREQLLGIAREYEFSSKRLNGSVSASDSADMVMDSYMRQFASGRRTWLDVMNSVREAYTAQIDAIDARIAAHSALARLMLLSGDWAPVKTEAAS
jgi:adhesin transport system outer membrane protein